MTSLAYKKPQAISRDQNKAAAKRQTVSTRANTTNLGECKQGSG